MSETGKVYLVGAGVGNEDYLTIKGKQLLGMAEVVIYDALVDESLLNLVPEKLLKTKRWQTWRAS